MARRKKGLSAVGAWTTALLIGGGVFIFFITLLTKVDFSGGDEQSIHISEDLPTNFRPVYKKLEAAKQKEVKALPIIKPSRVRWGYAGDLGPRFWGGLDQKFALCQHGRSQSPINLTRSLQTQDLNKLSFRYRSGAVAWRHSGKTVVGGVPVGSSLIFNNRRFDLRNITFHVRSEHALNGLLYDMEIQLLHRDRGGNVLVVAILVEEGAPQRYVKELWHKLPEVRGEKVTEVTLEVEKLLPQHKFYYHYAGSLTTPPCTEGVQWVVMGEPIQFSAKQIRQMVQLNGGLNNRPVQPTHARKSLFFAH